MKAIEDGRVRPEGIDLIFLNYRVEETYEHRTDVINLAVNAC